jgi:4-amino-4-deoxy-L-arabinose transferase-like glycosyltransferase
MSLQTGPVASAGRSTYVLSRRTWWVAVIALLTLFSCELFFSTRQESQVFDESAHLFAGFEYWKHADFGLNPEHPPLVKLIAATPLLPLKLKEPPMAPIPFFKVQAFIGATQFLYGADADSLIMRGRMMVAAVFAIGLALLVLAAGREMFGPETALLALALLVLEPVLLANGALVTTDIGLACLFFATIYAFYRYVKQPSPTNLALCAVASGLAMVAKHSGALVLPTIAILIVFELVFRWWQPTSASPKASTRSIARQARQLCLALFCIAVVSYGILWAFYGFHYAARPTGLQLLPPLAAYSGLLSSPVEKAIIGFCAQHHLFPEAYLYGWVDILQIPGTRPTFVFGKIYSTGQWFFFPAMLIVKSTITLLVLLVLVPFAGLGKYRRELLFLTIPPAFFLLIAIFSDLNLGVRHILPLYPFLVVLGAAAGWKLAARSRRAAIGVAALVLLAAVSSLHAYPNYLAYSNEAFGGPSNTYRVVTDANADWGQSLKWVKRYLDDHHVSDCWFDYNVPFVSPAYYKIGCKPLVSAFNRWGMGTSAPVPPSIKGTILISATEAEGLLWGPDELNPYQIFRKRRPDALINNVVLVYNGTFEVPLLSAFSHVAGAYGLLGQRKVAEAVTEAQAAVNQAPNCAEVRASLGQVLMAAGRKAEAQEAFATAIQMARANHPDYQKSLIRALEHPGS